MQLANVSMLFVGLPVSGMPECVRVRPGRQEMVVIPGGIIHL